MARVGWSPPRVRRDPDWRPGGGRLVVADGAGLSTVQCRRHHADAHAPARRKGTPTPEWSPDGGFIARSHTGRRWAVFRLGARSTPFGQTGSGRHVVVHSPKCRQSSSEDVGLAWGSAPAAAAGSPTCEAATGSQTPGEGGTDERLHQAPAECARALAEALPRGRYRREERDPCRYARFLHALGRRNRQVPGGARPPGAAGRRALPSAQALRSASYELHPLQGLERGLQPARERGSQRAQVRRTVKRTGDHDGPLLPARGRHGPRRGRIAGEEEPPLSTGPPLRQHGRVRIPSQESRGVAQSGALCQSPHSRQRQRSMSLQFHGPSRRPLNLSERFLGRPHRHRRNKDPGPECSRLGTKTCHLYPQEGSRCNA